MPKARPSTIAWWLIGVVSLFAVTAAPVWADMWTPPESHFAGSEGISSGSENKWGWADYDSSGPLDWAEACETDYPSSNNPTSAWQIYCQTDGWDICSGQSTYQHDMVTNQTYSGMGGQNYVLSDWAYGTYQNCTSGHSYMISGYFQVTVNSGGSWEPGSPDYGSGSTGNF